MFIKKKELARIKRKLETLEATITLTTNKLKCICTHKKFNFTVSKGLFYIGLIYYIKTCCICGKEFDLNKDEWEHQKNKQQQRYHEKELKNIKSKCASNTKS